VEFRFFCHIMIITVSVIYIIPYFHEGLGLMYFADSSTNTAIFDFAETNFCTFFFEFQQLNEIQWWLEALETLFIPFYAVG